MCLKLKKRRLIQVTSCRECPHSQVVIEDCWDPVSVRHCVPLNRQVAKSYGDEGEPDTPIPDACPLEVK